MATTYGAAAMPLAFGSGLPTGQSEDEFFEQFIDTAMTADQSFLLNTSDLEVSSLDYLSPSTTSECTKSPGRQSQNNSHAGTSLSPGTSSLVLTPTSTLPEYRDAALFEDPEAFDHTTSPEGSFSSDEYVHVDLPAESQPRGIGRQAQVMINPPPPASGPGASRRFAHHSRDTTNVRPHTVAPNQSSSSFVSTSSAGGWMDPPNNGGQWGHFDPSTLYFDNNPFAPTSTGHDLLSGITADDHATPRTLSSNLPFRPVDGHVDAFSSAPPHPELYGFHFQHPQPLLTPSSSAAHYQQFFQHATTQSAQHSAAQAFAQTRAFQQSFPPQYAPPQAQSNAGMIVPSQTLDESFGTPMSSMAPHGAEPTASQADRANYSHVTARQQQLRQARAVQHQQRARMSPAVTVVPSSRQLKPAAPGASHAGAAAGEQLTRRGGRKKGSTLAQGTRDKSSKMRKTGACWSCAMQRDPCQGEDTPCSRCVSKREKGLPMYFACNRSKLPDLVHDFLPPSMTGMHQKQSIEDCVSERVVRFEEGNSLDVYLTSGYGPALKWRLFEFIPKGDELLGQLQYLQDPATGQTRSYHKYSPPFALIKLDTSDDQYFETYLNKLLEPDCLIEFGYTCFEEESQMCNEYQAQLLQTMCDLYLRTVDHELGDLLRKILRMMIITYIMGHTLTILEGTLDVVLSSVNYSRRPSQISAQHISPRLANRQLKFFFSVCRQQIYDNVLNWLQQILHSSGKKEDTWLLSFCAMLGFAMVLEEAQRTIWIQADAKAQKGEMDPDEAEREAINACLRIDDRYEFLVGLFRCKYRDKKWGTGSFGDNTPMMNDPVSHQFLQDVFNLSFVERRIHLQSRHKVPPSRENECLHTSRLVAMFLLPFIGEQR